MNAEGLAILAVCDPRVRVTTSDLYYTANEAAADMDVTAVLMRAVMVDVQAEAGRWFADVVMRLHRAAGGVVH